MALTDRDIDGIAARVRPHFEPEFQDTAELLAGQIARVVGAKAKQLRPQTTVRELLAWYGIDDWIAPADSLEHVERVMAIEEQIGIPIPDAVAGQPQTAQFRDLVVHQARLRRAA